MIEKNKNNALNAPDTTDTTSTTNTVVDTELMLFKNEEFGSVRVKMIDNEPWFVGKDVAVALGYAKPENAIGTHVELEDKTTTLIQGTGSNYKSKTVIINESGLYSLILSSKLESAKKFKKWVTGEILPSIRKTGGYVNDDEMFINTYLPNVDEQTRLLFKSNLMVIRDLNGKIDGLNEEVKGLNEKLGDKDKEIAGKNKELESKAKELESKAKELDNKNEEPDMDFSQDMDYIEASFMSDYNIDLTNTTMHWWKFYNLINGLSNSEMGNCCVLNRVRNLRNYDTKEIKDPKERKKVEEAKKQVALKKEHKKREFSEKEQKNMEEFYKSIGF